MNLGLFKEIIRQCRNRFSLEKIALMGLGEPFLHPDIIAMSRYAKEGGVRHLFTSTNATLLDKRMSEEIVLNSGFDLVSFSMDGATKETYESLRVNAKFDDVVDNIDFFLATRRKYGRRNPVANIQILVMKETHREVSRFVEFWNKRLERYDIIFIRDVDTFGGQVEDHRLSHQFPNSKRRPCIQLWRDLAISTEGLVTVCCKDIFYKLSVGSVLEHPIAEIWKNRKWQDIRHIHKSARWKEISLCRDCNEWNQ